jgi:hypothetical protein
MKRFRRVSQDLSTTAEYLTLLANGDVITVYTVYPGFVIKSYLFFYLKEKIINSKQTESQCGLTLRICKQKLKSRLIILDEIE